MHAPFEVISGSIRCELGEGLWWSVREQALYWVDILGQALHRCSPAERALRSWSVPQKIGWVIERRDRPGFIAGLQSGFVELQLDPFEIRPLIDPEPELPGNRMNDAKADSRGRIWAGTMDAEIRNVSGSLYRLDPNLQVTRIDSGYLVTNGPAFSPADDVMYHTDTGMGVVYRFDVTAAGEAINKQPFITFEEEWGKPDGMTVDAEGALWIAHWGGGRVSRFTPDGRLDRVIRLPASRLTNCVFGGTHLDRLFVTSAAQGCADEPLAGATFEVDPGVRGLPPRCFGG